MYHYFEVCPGIPLTNVRKLAPFVKEVMEVAEELDLANRRDLDEIWDHIETETTNPLVLELFALLRDNADKIKLVSSYSGAGDRPYWIEYITDVEMPAANAFSVAFSSPELVKVAEVVKEFENFCAQKMSAELLTELSDYIGLAFNSVTS